ncbi:hypothetical protein [Candidatus Magnetobacterium casense]|uniref:Uncharacterized protein n=1 Tax=Candidatus Magnetobacterium casense TaxID=1455061 RepID=A0ABS6RYJ1_9BACT|nr:hypothetical protein [Candidatus Magnetobacterium casensis]MBV6341482.1 hypothetical protein [Candidatus Magnetobacterium casensis]
MKKKNINRIGLDEDEMWGIVMPMVDPEMQLLSTDAAQAIFRKVIEAIYVNNEQIAKDLAKAGIFIPD